MTDVPVLATRNWKEEDVKNLEGEVLYKTLANKVREDAVLEHLLKRPRVARVQIRNTLLGDRFTITMEVRDDEDLAIMRRIRAILKSRSFRRSVNEQKKG